VRSNDSAWCQALPQRMVVLPGNATRGRWPRTKQLPQEGHLPNVIAGMRPDDVQHLQAGPLAALGQRVRLM